MKQDCRLIATLPSLTRLDNIKVIFRSAFVDEIRFNTGSQSPYSEFETLEILRNFSREYGKKVWIDLKGRQLRVIKWADPLYSCIELNHEVEVLGEAKIYLRNDDVTNIMHVRDGSKIFVNPIPRHAVGSGQSVNIIARDVKIKGYLTEKDEKYLRVCNSLDMQNIMASFVECYDDLAEIFKFLPKANIVAKVESKKGLKFILENCFRFNLMAAREDLYIELEHSPITLSYLKRIAMKDPDAICASRIFSSLDSSSSVSLADYEDLELMYEMGYRNFMLCDNICNYHFREAMKAWEDFLYA